MNQPTRLQGVFAPVLTPFNADHSPAPDRLVRHCRWLVDQRVGLAVFGTNSEGNSLNVTEKRRLLDTLIEAGLPAERMMPGTGACAPTDTIELTRHAVRSGCGGVLMLPPFYYKGVTDEGLYRAFAGVIDAVADKRLRIYLYHIPQVSNVPISLDLIDRLLGRYPGTIAGVKDSSGDWNNTRAMLEQFQPQGFDVFAGSETFLLATLRGGGAGCISATANVNPGAIARLAASWRQADAERQQAALDAVRKVFQSMPMIPALKAAIAHFSGDAVWGAVRPPLVSLTQAQGGALVSALEPTGFAMPGLAG
jgi:4-hydroxy-tetrahydrodipicolinate synthase